MFIKYHKQSIIEQPSLINRNSRFNEMNNVQLAHVLEYLNSIDYTITLGVRFLVMG